MINNNDLKTLDILCSLDETLSNNTIITLQPDFHKILIHHATLKMTDWLTQKFQMPLSFRLERVNLLGEQNVHFTLSCRSFAQSLFFNIDFNKDGKFTFSSNVDFNADIHIQKEPEPPQQISVA